MQGIRLGLQRVEAADRDLNAAGELARRHPRAQRDALGGADALDDFNAQADIVLDEALIEIARPKLMLGQKLFRPRRGRDAIEDIAKAGIDLRRQDVGEAAAALFLLQAGGSLRRVRVRVQGLDDGAEQRFLAAEMMVERLPGQAGFLGDGFHRRPPVAELSEDGHGRVQYPLLGVH